MKAISALILALLLSLPGRCANITVTYYEPEGSPEWPQEAKDAFEFAVAIWEQTVYSPVEIKVQAYFWPFTVNMAMEIESEPSYALPSDYVLNFGSSHPSYYPQHQYAPALGEKLNGGPLNWSNGPAHFRVYMNSEVSWDYSESYNPSQGHYDFISRTLREIGHGLGFVSSAARSPSLNQPSHSLIPYILDRHIVNLNSTYLNSISQSFSNVFLTSNDVYYNGSNAVAANFGAWPKLHARSVWKTRNVSTWDSTEFSATDPDALMQGGSAANSAQDFHRQIGKVTKGVMADIGWDLEPPNGIPESNDMSRIPLLPNPSSSGYFYLDSPESGYYKLYDLSGKLILKGSFSPNELTRVDISSQPNALYLVDIITTTQNSHYKLVKTESR